jgi:predicted negative regulator of RcsB-dependent stress response
MARRKPRRRGPQDPEEILNFAQQSLDYVRPYLKWLITAGVILALGLLWWGGSAYLKHSREASAQAALEKVQPQLNQPDRAPEAIKKLDALINNYPTTKAAQMARLFKANLFYQTGKYADAAKAYEGLRSALGNQDPNGWGPFITASLSYCYEAQGDYAKAAQTLKPLVDQVGGNYQAILLSRLAMLYDKAGNRTEADMVYQRLLSKTKNPALASYWKEKLARSAKTGQPVDKQEKN